MGRVSASPLIQSEAVVHVSPLVSEIAIGADLKRNDPRDLGDRPINGGGPWFVVQAKPNCCGIARRNLGRQGFVTFAPTLDVTRRHRDGFRTTQALLFPGYVFVAAGESGNRWRSINSTYGVGRIVSFCGTPAPLPGDFVEALMARTDVDGRLLPEPKACPLAVGDDVRITVGPLADFVGEIVKMSSDLRVMLLLDLLGGKTRVTVPAGHLTKLPSTGISA